jgi:hypothetical protein
LRRIQVSSAKASPFFLQTILPARPMLQESLPSWPSLSPPLGQKQKSPASEAKDRAKDKNCTALGKTKPA